MLSRPVLQPAALTLASLVLLLFATELGFLHRWLWTVSLTGGQWLTCLALVRTELAYEKSDEGWRPGWASSSSSGRWGAPSGAC